MQNMKQIELSLESESQTHNPASNHSYNQQVYFLNYSSI